MGGIDWSALPIVAEIIGITDMEELVEQLVEIRAWNRNQGSN